MDVPSVSVRLRMARREIRRMSDERLDRNLRSAAGVSAGLGWDEAQRVIMRLDPEARRQIIAESWEWQEKQLARLEEAARLRGAID